MSIIFLFLNTGFSVNDVQNPPLFNSEATHKLKNFSGESQAAIAEVNNAFGYEGRERGEGWR